MKSFISRRIAKTSTVFTTFTAVFLSFSMSSMQANGQSRPDQDPLLKAVRMLENPDNHATGEAEKVRPQFSSVRLFMDQISESKSQQNARAKVVLGNSGSTDQQWKAPEVPSQVSPVAKSGVASVQTDKTSSVKSKPRTQPTAATAKAADNSFQGKQVSFEQDVQGGPAVPEFDELPLTRTQPTAQVARHQPISTSQYTGIHRLMNVELRQFENNILSTWRSSVEASATPDGRFVRVTLPTLNQASLEMMIDRKSKMITFAGDDSLKDNWHRIVAELDSQSSETNYAGEQTHRIRTFSTPPQSGTIRQVAYYMGLTQDQDQDQGSLTIPPGTQLPEGQIQGLKNKVKIIEDPETGFLTLVGDKEDLALLTDIIDRINEDSAAKQPTVQRLALENIQSESYAEQIQDLYDQAYAPTNGAAQIIPQSTPNSLIVVAQPEGIKAIEQIVSEMDVATPDSEMGDSKTFSLKHISAVDAKDRLETFFGVANRNDGEIRLPNAPVIVISDLRSNRVTVKGAAQFIRQAEALLKSIDVAGTSTVDQVRIFPLKNTLAEDLALVVQSTINGHLTGPVPGFNPNQQAAGNAQGAAGQQQVGPNTSQPRSQGLSISKKDGSGDVSSGIMFDVRVTADRNSNSLVVTGPAQSMSLVGELIKQLDRIPDVELSVKVFEIIHGDATSLLTMLETLFGTDQQQVAGQGQTNLTQLPLQGTGSDGQTLTNLRFSVDFRTNTIVASGPAADLQVVEDLINRLDTSDIRASQTNVYRLSNAPALDISEAISSWLDNRNEIITNDPRQNTETGVSNRGIIVVPEVVSNSLIVSCLPEYRQEIEGIIRALDRRPPMVKVKVLIAEVNLNTLEEFGVEVGIQDSLLFDRGTIVDAAGAITGGIGFPFNNQQVANSNATFSNTVAGQALSNLGIGRINNNLGYGGLVLSGGSESVNILMRALKDRQCVRILSKPHIVTLENLQGRISIGAEVPRVSGTSLTNFGTTQNIEFVDVGVILEVTPRVSPDGLIVMAVNAKRSSVGGDDSAITIGFGNNGEPIRAPQIIETEANTTLMSRSGQTVVFSGLIQETKSHSERGAPILSDLPVIGPLFKFESDEASRSELLIIMTPYLITDEQDLAMLNQDEAERMHWCECDVAEIYGNTEHARHLSSSAPVETFRPAVDPLGNNPLQSVPVETDVTPYDAVAPARTSNARRSRRR